MLVLSRRTDEELVIGTGVIVRVLSITGNKVKLGVTAAPSVPVVRGELIKVRAAREGGRVTANKKRPIA